MQTEAETTTLLTWGFFIVIGLGVLLLIGLWFKKKRKVSPFFVFACAHLLFTTLGFFQFLRLMEPKPDVLSVMLSETNSLMIGMAGVWWGLSMLCLYFGIYHLVKSKKPDSD